ncbi:MAG: hypothetical protein ACJ77K_03770 [Bacteroidia bacterium]
MKDCVLRWFVFLVLFAPVFPVFSQPAYNQDSLISSKIRDLTAFWRKYNDISVYRSTYEPLSAIPPVYLKKAVDSVSAADYREKVNEAKIAALKQDIGLAGAASYTENFDPGPGDDNLVYRRRFQTGLDWNILSDGYLENRYRQQILENENTIGSLTPRKKFNGDDYIAISHRIIYSFNVHKLKLLQQRQQIIDDKISIANELYLLKHLSRVDLLQIMQQQVDVTSMNLVYKDYNDQLAMQLNDKSIPENILPVFDIDLTSIFSLSDNKSVNDSILKLKIENLELAHKPVNDIHLNTQLRYNYYDLVSTGSANRNFLSAGIGLSVPIPLGIKANKNVISAEAKLLEYEQKENASTEQTDLLNYFYEFRYKLKQYNNFYQKRKRYEELIRVERVKEKFGDFEFNPLSALNLLDEMLAVDIEMLDLQQEMYLQLLDINTKVPGSDVATMVKGFTPDTVAIAPEKISKSLYIWSEAQSKYSPQYIEEYCRLNKISTAIISMRKDQANRQDAQALFDRLSAAGIKSELLAGNNKLLTAKDPAAFFDSLVSGIDLKKISAIHLDVEPHVLNDYDTNKEKYLSMYLELLKKAKSYCVQKGLKLSVSIPVFYPENTLREIYAQADNVYLMAYEHADADFIVRKVKEEFAMGADKTVIALRAKDFKNRTECEKLISELSATLNTGRFALHDLETFVKLDEQTIIQGK